MTAPGTSLKEKELETEAIRKAIRSWLRVCALGRENAKPRRMLLAYLNEQAFYHISDRRLRHLYAGLPVGYACKSPAGIYWIRPGVAADMAQLEREQKKKAVACFSRTKRASEEAERHAQPMIPGMEP